MELLGFLLRRILYNPSWFPWVPNFAHSWTNFKGTQLDDGWPESEKHALQAALSMVVVKNSRWMVGEFCMSYAGKLWKYTQTLLHTDAFTHRHFYTQTLLHTGAFTRRCFYTQTLSQTRLHTETFTHRRFYTQTLLHADAFTHRRFYTQMLLHTHFHTQRLLHTEAFEECLYMTFYGPELKLFCFWHQAHDGIELCCKRLQTFR